MLYRNVIQLEKKGFFLAVADLGGGGQQETESYAL
jgi:hypothetical protein